LHRLGLVLAVALVTMVVLAQPAAATFPGRNGRIAYTNGALEIATIKVDGTGIRVLTHFSGGGSPEAPQYSADGKWIVFDALVIGQWDIWKMRQDGSRLKQLTNDANIDDHAAFSPDGKQIVYSCNVAICVMNVDGTHAHVISSGPGDSPRYSPDGKKIAYWNSGDSNIHVMRADGSHDHAIASDPANDLYPDWSPDGKKIAFTSDRSGSSELWIVNADGSNPVQVTTTGAVGTPVFSPDGKKIAALDGSKNIFVVNLDGTGHRVVGTAAVAYIGWQPLP